jgi:hypothetical protein
MPVILATQEAEIRRIRKLVQGQPGEKFMRSYLNRKKLHMVASTGHSSYCKKHK